MPQICYGGVRVFEDGAASMDNVRRLDLGAIPLVLRMQSNGMNIDKSHFARMSPWLRMKCDQITQQVEDLTGYRINIGSPDQVEALLFKHIGLPVPDHFRKTDSGKRYQVNDEALSSIKGLHPCIPLIQDFTEYHKMRTSFVDVLPMVADPDGRVRTNLRVTRQVGGRISSSDPNLMAQPVRSNLKNNNGVGLGRWLRQGFIAGGKRRMGTIDQSQIEMRFAAHRAGCLEMIDTFLRNGDVHVETACRIFFKPLIAELGRMPTKAEAEAAGMDNMRHRYPAKRIGFGVLFGIMGQGLQDQIFVADDPTWTEADRQAFRAEWPIERCDQTIADWYAVYWEIRNYMEREFSKARRFGYTADMFGRIRRMGELKSVHKKIVAAAQRQVGSFGISSSAQGSMKLFMAECWDRLIEDKYKGYIEPLIQVHDECVFEETESGVGSMDDFLADSQRIMERVLYLNVPIKSGAGSGYNWGDLEK